MGRNSIVAGTGFDNPDGRNRASIIKRYIEDDMPITLEREPENKFDKNAIAVYIRVPWLFGLLKVSRQIGYIEAGTAKSLTKRMDAGEKITGKVASYHASSNAKHPRVSLVLEY